MIISRTPLRISLFGGGTDYPEWYRNHGGSVIGMAIDKYVYVTAMPLSPLHPYKFRLYWSKIERCQTASEIEHPVVREALRFINWQKPMGFSIIADLPARNGLGSSSAFTVGFVNVMQESHTLPQPPQQVLAVQAIHIERNLLSEVGGHQDQYFAAYGGFRRFDFSDEGVETTGTDLDEATQDHIASCLFLVHTGINRTASEISEEQEQNTRTGQIDAYLEHTFAVTQWAWERLHEPDFRVEELGGLLQEAWHWKKRFSSQITSPRVDALYDACMQAGSTGGKLCGAGWGGFLCMVVPPHKQAHFLETIRAPIVRVGIDREGSTIIWPQPKT